MWIGDHTLRGNPSPDAMMARKPERDYIAIVDGNLRHRDQVAEALLSFYAVQAFGDSTNALMGLGVSPPAMVLVGEYVPPSTGVNFMRAMRCERELGETPLLFVSDNGDPDVLAQALAAGANDCIIKPYRKSTLIKAISAQLNVKIERSWRELPPIVRSALEDSHSLYNSIADIFDDQICPIQYGAVAETCQVLVDAVGTGYHNLVIEGVREHDNSTFAHSIRVATLLALFGYSIGLPRAQQILLASGGFLHDVGKMGIRHSILNKTTPLTEDEQTVLRGHVPAAAKFLRASADMPRGIITIASQHHERMDGSGYPRGLDAKQLNELARMSAIVDLYASMTEGRAHQAKASSESVLHTMTEDLGRTLDQDLLVRFREILLDTVPTEK